MEIPWESLADATLQNLIEDFVTREGTEYGASEVPLARKVAQVRAQLRAGSVYISFDPRMETTTICVRTQS